MPEKIKGPAKARRFCSPSWCSNFRSLLVQLSVMLLRTPVLSASFAALLAVYVAATPTGPAPLCTDEPKLLEYTNSSYGSARSPHSPKPCQDEKYKYEEKPYPSASPSTPYPETPKTEEKSYPSATPYPETPKSEVRSYTSTPARSSYPDSSLHPPTEGVPKV